MVSGAVFPTLTTLSESVLSAVRNNYNHSSIQRARTRGRKTKHSSRKSDGRKGGEHSENSRVTKQLLLHADKISSGVITNLVNGADTAHLTTLTEEAILLPLSHQISSTDSYRDSCVNRAQCHKTPPASTSQSRRGLLHLHSPRLICPKLNHVTSPRHGVTSPQHHVTSPQHHVTSPQHHVTSPRHGVMSPQHHVTSPQHHVTSLLTVTRSMHKMTTLRDKPRTSFSGGGASDWTSVFLPNQLEVLEQCVAARAAYEKDPSHENAKMVMKNESSLRVRRKVLRELLPKLKLRAESDPHDPHVQSVLLLAHLLTGSGGVEQLVGNRKRPLSAVSVGILQDARGYRDIRDPRVQSDKFDTTAKNLQIMLDAMARISLTLFSCVLLYMIYNILSVVDGSKGGVGLGSLLGEDASFEVMTPDLTFEDVAGNEHALEEMEELVGYLTDPAKYVEMGCQIPKGYLLCGPPGVGKTLMAKALAGEAGVPFYYSSGSGFEEIFVGVGAGRVRKMFEQAQANAPSIIFIDEIDSIGQKRRINDLGYSNRGTLNQMLSCMDGFENNNGVIVIAATNEPDTLDSALTREGRFDTKISIRAPTLKGRLEILKVHTRNKVLSDKVDLENIATACTQMTGAQLATLANTAALRAVLEGREVITQDDFEFARARLLIGHINDDIEVSETELLNTAAHEAGHALLTVLREDITQRPVYISTILPRGSSLGHVQPVSKSDQHTQNIAQMIAQIDICMAGRVGEELHHDFAKNKVTTGCSSDMRSATYYAEVLIKQCGYSSKIGLVKAGNDEKSDLTEKVVHEEIKKLFDERYQIVKSEMIKHKKEWRALTDLLYRYKTLTGGEVKRILDGGVPDREPGDMLPSA